jgi:hypothetical protein
VGWLERHENGELLREAELAGYDVLLTIDHSIVHQQNLVGRRLSIVSIRSRTNQLEDLLPLVNAILKVLETISAGEVVSVP